MNLIHLSSGRLPQSNKEIIIDEVGVEFLNKNIDHTIDLDGNTYKIVGVYKKKVSSEPFNIQMITSFTEDSNNEEVNGVFNLKVDKNKRETINKIASDLGISEADIQKGNKVSINDFLYYHYDSEQLNFIDRISAKSEYVFYAVILIIAVFFTYGSVNVSIKERMVEFSILRCIGATTHKIRMLLIKESFFLAVFSLIPGIIISQFICYIISSFIIGNIISMDTYGIKYVFYPNMIIVVIIFTLLNVTIATIVPIIKMEKISPIESMKSEVICEKVKRRRSLKVIKRIFGYDGELAYKNIRGNNKSFIITTITSTLILTTFIVFTGYGNSVVTGYNMELENSKDMLLERYYDKYSGSDNIFQEIDEYKEDLEELNVAKSINSTVDCNLSGIFEDVSLNKSNGYWEKLYYTGESTVDFKGKESIYSYQIKLVILEDRELSKLITAEKLDVTLDDFKDNGVLIQSRKVLIGDMKPIFNLRAGEEFSLQINKDYEYYQNDSVENYSEDIKEKDNGLQLKYLGSVNENEIVNRDIYGGSQAIALITSREFYEKNKDVFISRKENDEMNEVGYSLKIILSLDHNLDREYGINKVRKYTNAKGLFAIDLKESNISIKNDIVILASIVYVVLFFTSITGIINIINNKSISINLRNKELGTLLAIGISKKRLKKILILESVIQWIIITIVSIIISCITLKVLYQVLIVNWMIIDGKNPIIDIVLSSGVLLIVNVISVYIPIKKLNYTDTIEIIRKNE